MGHCIPDLLPALLAYELTDEQAHQVVQHLAECDECRRGLVEVIAREYSQDVITSDQALGRPSQRRARRRAKKLLRKPRGKLSAPAQAENQRTRRRDAAFVWAVLAFFFMILCVLLLYIYTYAGHSPHYH
jgi:anti-sigma factor RsiW